MEYSLDDTLISVSGTSVRCMKCNQVFKVYKPTPSKAGKDEWLLRQAHGPFRTIGSLSALQQWIREGKISKDDLLSQKNGPWKRVGDIEQLKVFFADAAENPPPAAGRPKFENSEYQQTLRRPANRGENDSTEKFTKLEGQGEKPKKPDVKRVGAAGRVENEKPTLPPAPRSAKSGASLGDLDEEITHEFSRADSRPPGSILPTAASPTSAGSPAKSSGPSVSAGSSAKTGSAASTGSPAKGSGPSVSPGSVAAGVVAKAQKGRTLMMGSMPVTGYPAVDPKAGTSSSASDLRAGTSSMNASRESKPPESRPSEQRISQNPVATVGALQPSIFTGVPDARPSALTDAPDFSSIPSAKEDVAWGRDKPSTDAEPAWTEKNRGLPKIESRMESLPPARRGRTGKWLLLAAAVVGLGIAAFLLFTPSKGEVISTVNNIVVAPEEERFQKFFNRGVESFLLDTDTAFLQADREFQKALALKDGAPEVLAALGQMYAVWAQYFRDARLDASADLGKAQELEILSRSFEQKLKDAVQWSLQASAAAPKLKAALLAAADTARLSGNLEEASLKLKEAEALGKDADTEYIAVLIDIDSGFLPKEPADRLDKSQGAVPLIRALYRSARLRAAAGEKDAAKAALGKLFDLNSNHPQAKDLAARIEAKKTIPLVPKNLPSNASGALVASSEHPPKSAEPSSSSMEFGASSSEKPQGIGAQLKKAGSLQHKGQTDAAKSLYESVLEREPANVEALTGVGYCYLDKGDNGNAVAYFRRAIKVNASYGPALMGTAETYKSMGQKEQALKYYRSYLLAIPSGGQSEMARKNAAILEAELEKPAEKHSAADEETVVDDSPPPSVSGASDKVEQEAAKTEDSKSDDVKSDDSKSDEPSAPEKSPISPLKKDTEE